jgi:hypothetical protein
MSLRVVGAGLAVRAAEGWAPLCAALGVPIPDEPFPRINTREQWAMIYGAAGSA